MNVTIAGSRAIPPGKVGRLIVGFLDALPPRTVVLLREGKWTEPGEFEQMTAMVCELIGVEVQWRRVEIDMEAGLVGRKAVFDRDLQMVTESELVVCFTTLEQAYDMESGTTALAQKALDAEVPVYHFALGKHGLVIVGVHDPEDKHERLMEVLT